MVSWSILQKPEPRGRGAGRRVNLCAGGSRQITAKQGGIRRGQNFRFLLFLPEALRMVRHRACSIVVKGAMVRESRDTVVNWPRIGKQLSVFSQKFWKRKIYFRFRELYVLTLFFMFCFSSLNRCWTAVGPEPHIPLLHFFRFVLVLCCCWFCSVSSKTVRIFHIVIKIV